MTEKKSLLLYKKKDDFQNFQKIEVKIKEEFENEFRNLLTQKSLKKCWTECLKVFKI
jgi:hypothetical protein